MQLSNDSKFPSRPPEKIIQSFCRAAVMADEWEAEYSPDRASAFLSLLPSGFDLTCFAHRSGEMTGIDPSQPDHCADLQPGTLSRAHQPWSTNSSWCLTGVKAQRKWLTAKLLIRWVNHPGVCRSHSRAEIHTNNNRFYWFGLNVLIEERKPCK